MRTLLVDTERLGAVLLREAPRRLERDGAPVTNSDGEALYMGRIVLPGGAKNAYTDQATPREVRIKRTGTDGGLRPGIVKLAGRCTLTRWYVRGGRGVNAKSELTLSAERVEPAANETPTIAGWLPVELDYPNRSDAPLL